MLLLQCFEKKLLWSLLSVNVKVLNLCVSPGRAAGIYTQLYI